MNRGVFIFCLPWLGCGARTTPSSLETHAADAEVVEVVDADAQVVEATVDAGSTDACASMHRSCGRCGTQVQACSGEWSPCSGEGVCAPGSSEVSSEGCESGSVRKKACEDTCAWRSSECHPIGWTPIAPSPLSGRAYMSAAWTGTEMVIWSGGDLEYKVDGAAYEKATNTWRKIASKLPWVLASGRAAASTVWTGNEMLVWGGRSPMGPLATGGAYDPKKDTWRRISDGSLVPRANSVAAWSAATKRMIVWGGTNDDFTYYPDGAAYDPALDAWTPLAAAPLQGRELASSAWLGSRLVIWGGRGKSVFGDGAIYDPATNTWEKLPPAPIAARFSAAGFSTSSGFVVYGGRANAVGTDAPTDGASWSASAGWSLLPTPDDAHFGMTTRRADAISFTDGERLFILGGADANAPPIPPTTVGRGGSYSAGAWRAELEAPSDRVWAAVAWTGEEALIWGGLSIVDHVYTWRNDGGTYWNP